MIHSTFLCGFAMLCVAAFPPPSDQVGVYGAIDKVVLMPSADAAQRVEVWGAFCIAQGPNGDAYAPARAGYLLFEMPADLAADKQEAVRSEWRDLQKHAGSGQAVAFGSRYQQRGVKVWSSADAQPAAAAYQMAGGVHPMQRADYGPLRQLRHLPGCKAPLGAGAVTVVGGRRPAQKVTLVASNAPRADDGARYLFELRQADGSIHASPAVTPGEGETSWVVEVVLQPGELVTWSVRLLHPDLPVAAVAQATFVVGTTGGDEKK